MRYFFSLQIDTDIEVLPSFTGLERVPTGHGWGRNGAKHSSQKAKRKRKKKGEKKEENNLGIISISVDVSLDFGTTDAAKLGKKKNRRFRSEVLRSGPGVEGLEAGCDCSSLIAEPSIWKETSFG